ncbi:MAG TPA: hypothetical protein VF938_03585 [Candidatus Angelobacter sp.]
MSKLILQQSSFRSQLGRRGRSETGPWIAGTCRVEWENATRPLHRDAMQIRCGFTDLHGEEEVEVRSGLDRLGLGSGSGLFALQISGATLAFFNFVILLAHKSLLSEAIPVV